MSIEYINEIILISVIFLDKYRSIGHWLVMNGPRKGLGI